jgi:hypothetical protein
MSNGFREVLNAFIQAPSELQSDAVYSWVHSVALRIISTCLYADDQQQQQPVTAVTVTETEKSETAAAVTDTVTDDEDETVESVTPRTLVAGALGKLHMVSTLYYIALVLRYDDTSASKCLVDVHSVFVCKFCE